MSLRIEWRVGQNSGTHVPPDSVVLCDPDNAYGVRRVDTGEVIVAAGTAMTLYTPSTPETKSVYYYYTLAESAQSVEYEYYIKVTETVNGVENTYYINGHAQGAPAWYDPYTLGGVRRLLVDISGRYDLVRDAANGDYTDLGRANLFINEAQRWLDRRLPHHKSKAKLYKDVGIGQNCITFTQARSVQDVFEVTVEDGHACYTRIDWSTLRVGLAPDQYALDELGDLPDGAENITFGKAHWPVHSIYIYPNDESARVVLIEANWYCPRLVNDPDQSFWTVQHPLLLAHTAQMLIEIGMRNSAGVADFMGSIEDDVRKIYHDLVDEESSGPAYCWRME